MVVFEVRPQNEDPNRTCITVTGSRIYYPGNIGTPTGSLDLVKLMINSVLSRRNAPFFCFDFKKLSPNPNGSTWVCAQKNYQIFHKNSLRNIISRDWSRMDRFILRFSGVAMAYRSQAGLPVTCCVCVLIRRDTKKQTQHLVYGAINGAPSNFS